MPVEMPINEPSLLSDWDLPTPYVATIAVAVQDIDAYDHVNNAVYVTWLDRAAWEHSAALGLPIDTCLALDKGMAVVRSCIAYLRPALLGDSILVGTWLLAGDSKLRVGRRFQVRRQSDGLTLARAEIQYACIELSSGRPARWPAEFRERYQPLEAVVTAAAALAPV
jgi:acyl-CoA thioester hydrolase